MMTDNLKQRIHDYFYIPLETKCTLSKRNVVVGKYICILMLLWACISLFVEIVPRKPIDVVNVIYYSVFIAASGFFIIVSGVSKNSNYYLNQALLIVLSTSVFCLMYFNLSCEICILYVMEFYFCIFASIIAFELPPVYYTMIIFIFYAEVVFVSRRDQLQEAYLNIDNAMFCLITIWFAFYKRHLVSQREGYKRQIEEMNRQLTVANYELERQNDSLMVSKEYLEDAVFSQSQELQLQKERLIRVQNNTIMSLSNLVENRDEDTGAHILRTREYVGIITLNALLSGKYDELNEQTVELYVKAAPMHDIGKIVVSDAILKKPGKLTPEEFEQIKLHTTKGGKIVEEVLGASAESEYVRITKEMTMLHHEKYDGTGYPRGLKGDDIPLSARIMAIADVFDALVSPRCYKEPIPVDEAFRIIEESAGSHFDPELTRIFLDCKDDILQIFEKYR